MKVKNIAFSGFAAAILATGAANAAPQIASKTYVDNKVKTDVNALQTTIENNYTKTEQLPGTIVTEIKNELVKEDSQLKSAIDTALDTKANAETVNQINATVNNLNSTVEGLKTNKADKITVAEGQAGNIATVDGNGQYQVSAIKTSELVTNDTVTEKIATALEGNESVKEIITTIVSNGDVVTNAIDKSVSDGTLKIELEKKANTADVYSKTEADALFDAKIPVPGAACAAESGRCVLSVVQGSDGRTGLSWIDVTAPLDDASAGTGTGE